METPYSIFTQYGLRSGRLGESLRLLLDEKATEAVRAEGQGILNGVLRDYRKMPKGVSHGRWGLVPVIDILVRNGLIESSKYWDSVITAQTKEMLFLSYGATPVKINAEDDFIAECIICASAYSALHDSLERLCMLERMIALVDELEQLLLTDLTPYTGSARLNARQLHSMLHFLRRMDSLGAYPVKTRKVMGILARYSKDAGIPDDADGRLLRHLLGELPLPKAETDDMRFFHMLYGLGKKAATENNEGSGNILPSDENQPDAFIGETIIPLDAEADSKSLSNDLTILMTLRVDSAERLRNFKACVSFLLANTDASIIVTEADIKPRGDIFPDEARVRYSFVKDANLYHLGHPRGINSSSTDPELAQSTKEEFIKICAMTQEQLREYISTWEWTQ